MKKGFTLIELLGVMVLISIILLLILPNIVNSIKKASGDTNQIMADLIYSATKTYIKGNNKYKETKGNIYCITINELVNEGLIDTPVKYGDDNDISDIKSVKLTYNNKWNFEIVNKSECVSNANFTCTRTNSSNVTTGYIPTNNYQKGDEYICKLNENTTNHFFVLNVVGNKVSLIADRNLDSDSKLKTGSTNATGWANSSNNANGPTNAYSYLESYTANWTNIPPIKGFNFVDMNKDSSYGYKGINVVSNGEVYTTRIYNKLNQTFEYTNVRARLPMYNEVTEVGCSTTASSCPNWISNYLTSSTDAGYWLMDSALGVYNRAYVVYYNQNISTTNAGVTTIGVRPVIELNKENLE